MASGCTVAGGKERIFSLGDFSGIASGARIYCESNDYVYELVTLLPKATDISQTARIGDVTIAAMCGIGANTVIMPENEIPEGVAIGALSFVPSQFPFEPWSVYAGNPIKLILPRDKENVLRQYYKS